MSDTLERAPLHEDMGECPPGGEAFWLTSDHGGHQARIRAAFWRGGTRGTVILFSGRTEYIEKYGRVIASFVSRGFCVATLDWRGQGLSDRACDDPMKGHVGRFSEYQADVDALLAAPQMADMPGPQVLVCHSMGGCIGMRALTAGRIKPALTIMSGPMLGIELAPHLRILAGILSRLAVAFGKPEIYAPQPGSDQSYVLITELEDNMLTHDREHFEWMQSHMRHAPEIALGGPTLGWMRASSEEMSALSVLAPPPGDMIMLLGDGEEIVSPDAIKNYAARSPNCQLEVLKACKHEAFMETPDVQARVWEVIDERLDGCV